MLICHFGKPAPPPETLLPVTPARSIDDAGDVRRRQVLQARRQHARVERPRADGPGVVDLDVEALRLQAIQVLEHRANLRDRSIRVEVHEIAVHALRAAASHQQLRCERGDRVVEIDVVVIHRRTKALEDPGAANRKARRNRVRRLRREGRYFRRSPSA